MLLVNLFAGQKYGRRYREQICEHSSGRKRWNK